MKTWKEAVVISFKVLTQPRHSQGVSDANPKSRIQLHRVFATCTWSVRRRWKENIKSDFKDLKWNEVIRSHVQIWASINDV